MPTSFEHLQKILYQGATRCVDIVEQCIGVIEQNQHLNAFIRAYADEARQQATLIDQKVKQGTAGPLAGMVIGLKDVLCYKDHPVQAGSKILEGFTSQFSATAVERLLAADAIIIGHQNCDEFAMGSSTETGCFGPTRNALNTSHVAGGSSGGSAVGVQARMCHVSLGSDTGGSVRQPAAFCGIVGLKPTYARISRYGLVAYASSFDTIGIFAQHIADCARVFAAIAGADGRDNTASRKEVPSYEQCIKPWNGKARIAYIPEALEHEGLQPEISVRMRFTIEQLQAAGHIVEAIRFPWLEYLLPTYYILTTAEASANLSRFDGIRYGARSASATTLEEIYTQTRTEGFGSEVKRRILLGTTILSEGHYDAYYTKAQQVRRIIKEQTDAILAAYDFIILPTTPTTAFKIGAFAEQDPIAMYLADVYTVQASLAGVPAISIPNGSDTQGLPIGLQVVAGGFQEAKLLGFVQYVTDLLGKTDL